MFSLCLVDLGLAPASGSIGPMVKGHIVSCSHLGDHWEKKLVWCSTKDCLAFLLSVSRVRVSLKGTVILPWDEEDGIHQDTP